jgi:hypothetical protein
MASEPDAVLIDSLKRAATDAVSNGTPMRLALKSGEVLEGVPESVAVDAMNAPAINTPLASFEREHFGPTEVTIMLAGTAVLAQEVREFAVVQS